MITVLFFIFNLKIKLTNTTFIIIIIIFCYHPFLKIKLSFERESFKN